MTVKVFKHAGLVAVGVLGAVACSGGLPSAGDAGAGDASVDGHGPQRDATQPKDGSSGSGSGSSTSGSSTGASSTSSNATSSSVDSSTTGSGSTGSTGTTASGGTSSSTTTTGTTSSTSSTTTADAGHDAGALPESRLIGPMTGNSVVSQTPTFTWMLPAGLTTAYVEICGTDNKCKSPVSLAPVTGVAGTAISSTPTTPLPRGPTFWRVITTGGAPSRVWQFYAPGPNAIKTASKVVWPSFADIEGDGFADLVYFNSATNTTTELAGSASGVGGGVQSSYAGGTALYTGGDVNGDGYSDVILAAGGSVLTLLGATDGFAAKALTTTVTGLAVYPGAVGDFNGDGYADVVAFVAGQALVEINGSSAGLATTAPASFPLPSGAVGAPGLATAGDLNGDGYMDLIVMEGAYGGGAGRVWVYLGSSEGLVTTQAQTLLAPVAASDFGEQSVLPSVGGTVTSDVNGDGWLDLFIWGGGAAPSIYVYPGSATGFSMTPSTSFALSNKISGSPYTAGADVNGDGYGDLLLADVDQVKIFQGGPGGLPTSPSQTINGGSIPGSCVQGGMNCRLNAIALVGDVNGDGFSDFVAVGSDSNNFGVPALYQGSGAIPQIPAGTPANMNVSTFW